MRSVPTSVTTPPPSDQSQDIGILLGSPTGGKLFTFPAGLEGMTFTFGSRAVMTQALDRVWVDALGKSVPTVTLSGHTGWRPLRDGRDGKQQFAYMLRLHLEHMDALARSPSSPQSLLVLHDPTTGLTLRCFATDLRIIRDKTRTLFYQFEWDLTVVKILSFKADPSQHWVGSKLGTSYTGTTPPPSQQRRSTAEDAARINTRGSVTIPAGATSYTVQSGDTLSKIVQARYGLTTTDQVNHAVQVVLSYPRNRAIQNPNFIYPGEVIYFPTRLS